MQAATVLMIQKDMQDLHCLHLPLRLPSLPADITDLGDSSASTSPLTLMLGKMERDLHN